MSQLLSLFVLSALMTMGQVASSEAVSAPVYKLVNLGTEWDVRLMDINNKGQVVGTRTGGGPFLYDGSFKQLNFRGIPYSINDKGSIVGSYCLDAACVESHAFLLDKDGKFTDLMPGVQSVARKINNKDEIIGEAYFPGASTYRGFLWREGGIQFLDFLPVDINQQGHIVGCKTGYLDYYSSKCFFYADGNATALEVSFVDRVDPNRIWDLACWPHALNDADVVVGDMPRDYMLAGLADPYTWKDGVFARMPQDRQSYTQVGVDINNKNEVVVTTYNHDLGGPDMKTGRLWTQGNIYALQQLLQSSDIGKWWVYSVVRMNDKGDIIAVAVRLPYDFHSVLLQRVDKK